MTFKSSETAKTEVSYKYNNMLGFIQIKLQHIINIENRIEIEKYQALRPTNTPTNKIFWSHQDQY